MKTKREHEKTQTTIARAIICCWVCSAIFVVLVGILSLIVGCIVSVPLFYIMLDAEKQAKKPKPVSNIWNHGDSLYQKLKHLDELRCNETITVDEFAELQKELIIQVQNE